MGQEKKVLEIKRRTKGAGGMMAYANRASI
jgi:hypothetical protein